MHLEEEENSDEEPYFRSVAIGRKSEANIYFMKVSEFHPASAIIALGTDELDELYSYVKQNDGIAIVEDIEDKPVDKSQLSIWRYH